MIDRRLVAVLFGTLLLATSCGSGDDTATSGGEPAPTSSAPGSGADPTQPTTTPTIPTTVSGDPLPALADSGVDEAGGLLAPTVEGTDILTGDVVTIAPTGRSMAVAFFAHWCPHCQREVAEITEWLETNDLPEGVDLIAVSTLEDSSRDNHPPADWLAGEGWSFPVIADTSDFSVATSYGVSAVPFWAFLDAEGRVLARVADNLGPESLKLLLQDIG